MFLNKFHEVKGTLLFRLTVYYAAIFSLSSLFILFVFYFKIHTVTMQNMDDELIDEVEKYAGIMRENGIEGVKEEIDDASNAEDPNEEFFRVMTFKGDIVASTNTSTWGALDNDENLVQLQSGESLHIIQTLTIPGRKFKARMITAILSPDTILQIGDTFEDAENYLQIFRNWFLVLLIPVTALAAIAGWFMSRRALFDVENVTQTAYEISKGAFDRRVKVKDRFDEIKKLGETFNIMLDQIETLLRSMREVNDNIAHDLRSPLTRIRGIAEMTLMRESSVDNYKEMAASTIEECDRLIEMINTMLDISEVQAGINRAEIIDVDVANLVRDACELFRPIANDKKIKLSHDIPEAIIFHGDRKKLQRIVSNLLDNAIKYTPEGGSVSISATAEERKINIAFEDTGRGISERDMPHIFERFYKCDKSRSRGGVGLGLSLVKVFTEAMNGTVNVTSTVNKGSRFTVTLPQQASLEIQHS